MSTKSELFYKYITYLNPYDVDMHLKASLTGINQLADRAAFDHIRKLGFSTEFMLEQKLAWVLYQKDFRILQDLVLNKAYRINTLITGRDSIFTYRDFIISDPDGHVCIEISSAWLLFDLVNRSMLRKYPDDIELLIAQGNELKALPRPVKLKALQLDNADFEMTHIVNYIDLDSNKHISNQSLIRKLSELLPYDLMLENRICSARIQFKSEAFLGEKLYIKANVHTEDEVQLVCSNQSKTIALASFQFEKRI